MAAVSTPGRQALRRLLRNRLAIVGLVIVTLVVIVGGSRGAFDRSARRRCGCDDLGQCGG